MAIRPKLRPKDDEFKKIVAAANSGGGDNNAPAASGKGGGKSVNPLAKEGSADYKKMQKANAPDSFYGYYDQNTGDYVPWYIDMINGGGANAAGPTFEGGPLAGRMAGGLLNAAGVSPYGQDRPRAFMPMEAYRGGKDKPAPFDYRSGASAAPAPTGVIDAAVSTPDPINVPQDFSNLSNAAATRRSLVGYSPQVVAGAPNIPQVQPDLSGVSAAPAVRAGLVGYNPQVVPGVQVEAMTEMPTVSQMRDYLLTKNIFTDYMPDDLVMDMYKLQRGM